jgi:hypothetical protein
MPAAATTVQRWQRRLSNRRDVAASDDCDFRIHCRSPLVSINAAAMEIALSGDAESVNQFRMRQLFDVGY